MEAEVCKLAPDHWPILSIADICTRVTSGGTPSRKRPDFYQNGVWPWVKTQELTDGWIENTEEQITEEAVAESSAKVLPQHTVLMAMYGATVGQLGILRRPMTCNQACSAMIVDSAKADFRYLYYQLLNSRSQIRGLATGAAQQNLSGVLIKSLKYPFPTLTEQKAIARILGTLDDKIELNRRMNATLEAMARALFQSWFVDFDPVHAKAAGRPPSGMDTTTAALFPASFQDSALGEIPEGWGTVTLGSILDVLETGRRPKGGVSGFLSGVPSIGAESIWGIGEFDFGKTKYVPEEFFAKMSSGKVQHLDVLLYKDGGKPGEFRPRVGMFGHDFPFEEFGINEHVFRLRSSSVGQLYLYYSVADPRVLLDFANKGGKAAIPGINQQDVRSAVILQPPPYILEKFDKIIAPLVDRMLRNAKESRTLATLRDTLLPKLLSGASV